MVRCWLEWPKKYFFARFIRTPCHFRRFGAKTTLLNLFVNPITGSGLPQPLKKSMDQILHNFVPSLDVHNFFSIQQFVLKYVQTFMLRIDYNKKNLYPCHGVRTICPTDCSSQIVQKCYLTVY